jgi:hypothetical protein
MRFLISICAAAASLTFAARSEAQSIRTASAQPYIDDVVPAQNDYLKSSEGGGILSYSAPDGTLVSKTVCGAFVGRVYKNAFPALTQSVMQGLFDGPNADANQGLPDSAHWYGAIEGNGGTGWSYASGGKTYSMARARIDLDGAGTPVLRVVDTQATLPFLGAVIAAKYTNASGDSGHTMLAKSAQWIAEPANAPADTFATIEVRLWDSTKSPHNAADGAPDDRTDTRIGQEPGGADGNDYDEGAGEASIRIFLSSDRADGGYDILGWTWSTTDDAAVYANDASGRPITLGFFRW